MRLAFLLRVDGLALFLVMETRESLHLESRVKEKALPILRENWNNLPWLVSALQCFAKVQALCCQRGVKFSYSCHFGLFLN